MADRRGRIAGWQVVIAVVLLSALATGCGSGAEGSGSAEVTVTEAATATPSPGAPADAADRDGEDKQYPELDLAGTQTPGPTSTAPTTDPPTTSPTFSVPLVPAGEPATNGSWALTLHGLSDPLPPASEFATPGEGSRFVGLDAEVVNVGEDKRTFSASFSMELMLQDGSVLDVRVATLHEPAPPGGELAPGERQRGLVVFEVPGAMGSLATEGIVVFGRSFATTEPVYLALP